MVIKIFGVALVLLAAVHAAPQNLHFVRQRYHEPTIQEMNAVLNCAETYERLPQPQWQFLKEAVDLYQAGNHSVTEKLTMFKELLEQHNITVTPRTSQELLGVFILTDFDGPVEKRAIELAHIVELEVPELFVDEDVKKMVIHTLELPIMISDKLFSELERMKSLDAKKTAQKRLRSVMLTEEYQKGSEMIQLGMLGRIFLCHINLVDGQESSLRAPFEYLRKISKM